MLYDRSLYQSLSVQTFCILVCAIAFRIIYLYTISFFYTSSNYIMLNVINAYGLSLIIVIGRKKYSF